jgi:hypothetical protein
MNPTDPLAQLRDIHLPDPITGWPPALAWWLLLCLGIIVITGLLRQLLLRHRARAYRRAARSELLLIHDNWRKEQDDNNYLQQLNTILKRVALQSFPTTDVAALNGNNWCGFLDQQWKKPPPTHFADTGLALAVYSPAQAHCDIDTIHSLAVSWLGQHRATSC